jgi:hypothetical protein
MESREPSMLMAVVQIGQMPVKQSFVGMVMGMRQVRDLFFPAVAAVIFKPYSSNTGPTMPPKKRLPARFKTSGFEMCLSVSSYYPLTYIPHFTIDSTMGMCFAPICRYLPRDK